MANLNQCNFIGNLARDPEMRFTPGGTAVTNFTVAVNDVWTKEGQKQERTEWVRVVTWGKLAENCCKLLTKGKSVFISGKMQTREWTDSEGTKRYTTEIVANTMQLLGGQAAQSQQDDNQGSNEPDEYPDVPF